jgi:hypothetical protein
VLDSPPAPQAAFVTLPAPIKGHTVPYTILYLIYPFKDFTRHTQQRVRLGHDGMAGPSAVSCTIGAVSVFGASIWELGVYYDMETHLRTPLSPPLDQHKALCAARN